MSDNTVAVLDSVSRFLDRQHGLYIDGQWRASAAEDRLAVYNPPMGSRSPPPPMPTNTTSRWRCSPPTKPSAKASGRNACR